jgi:hypothetical protein
MKLARCHVEFMQTRAYPRFAARVLPRPEPDNAERRRMLIDRCVNAHAYGEPRTRFHMENFCALLRMWRNNQERKPAWEKRETLRDYLTHLVACYGVPSGDQERVRLYFSRRWLRKLERTR